MSHLPLWILLTSLAAGIVIFFLPEDKSRARTFLNLFAAGVKLVFVGLLIAQVAQGIGHETRFELLPGIDLLLRADAFSVLFVTLSAALWLATTVYAVGYLEHSPDRSRFFGFFSLCVTATMGIALSGNLLSFLFFYELLTLATYPLIVHRETPGSLAAGRVYLLYTLGGGALALLGTAWLYALAGNVEFAAGGALAPSLIQEHGASLWAIFLLLFFGFGVKAALFPLHGWLPKAMIAPAPVSALLHAVAVVKAGAFGIVRLIYDIFGVTQAQAMGLLSLVAVLASITILYASFRALFQDELKKRLAYSTISQVSYIVLGTALFGPAGTVGGIVHLVHQGLLKITLFFCAGNLAETLGIHRVSQMQGVARRMPLTMAAFAFAAAGMIGLPLTAGFVTKWYLGLGAIESGAWWALFVLGISTLLNAAYFLPILFTAWFKKPPHPHGAIGAFKESSGWLLWPTLATALLALLSGLFAGADYGTLYWASVLTDLEYAGVLP
ncbi:MAG: complex I subunit 5 family protein [Campylobacterales bacterium]